MNSVKPPIDLSALPDDPGIYKMLDYRGVVIYVGKAKNLRKRVKSYFQSPERLDVKTNYLVANIANIETIATRSESDALILEAQLIKEYQPRYNIILKDDKSYPYIKITKELFPRIQVVRERVNDGATYFGPYASVGSTKYLLRMLYDLFPLRDCPQYIDLEDRQPKCLKLDMHKCLGPCVVKTIKSQYDELVDQLKRVLRGRDRQLIADLRQEMTSAADALKFEKAAQIRDRIAKLERLGHRQTVRLDQDGITALWGAAEGDDLIYVAVQTFVDGLLLYQRGFYLERPTDETRPAFIRECLLTYKEESEPIDLMVSDQWIADVAGEMAKSGYPIAKSVTVPQRGIKVELLESVRQNARLAIKRLVRDRTIVKAMPQREDPLIEMRRRLGLSQRPDRIWGIDISHLQGTNIVGSAVYFKNARPYKSGYRKFMIRSVSGDSNDPASIYEVVSRRLQRCFTDHEPLPNLILIDGGIGQINAAYRALIELGMQHEIDLISLAKQNEEIYRVGEQAPLVLSKDDSVLKLLQWVRDESHRFAVTFQRVKRRHTLETGILHDIPGLGPKRIQALYSHFKNSEQMLAASDSQIASVARLSPGIARMIRRRLIEFLGHDNQKDTTPTQ